MRKHVQIALMLIALTHLGWSQTTIFTGTTGNYLWSESSNWTNGLPGTAGGYTQFNANANLDISTSVLQIRSGGPGGILSAGGTLTVTGAGFTVAVLQDGGTGSTFNVDVPVIISSSDSYEALQVNGTDGILTFGENSDLTINTAARLVASGTKQINMNGILRGSSYVQFSGGANVTFGSTSDNSNFTSDFVYWGSGASVTVNTADNGVFVPSGQKVQVNNSGGSLTLNGANVYQGYLSIAGANDFLLNVNADQDLISSLFLGTATTTIAIGSNVKSISFADNSANSWSTGTLSISNFKNGLMKFGTTSDGLTSNQLGQIDIGGSTVYLDEEGYLIETGTAIWSGTNWSTSPGPSDNAVISGDYVNGSLEVNDLTIKSSNSVTILSGETLIVNGDLIINGTLDIASGGSLVTLGNVVGEATISRSTTFTDSEGKYSVVGSPVVGESTSSLGALVYAYDETVAYGSDGSTRFIEVISPEEMYAGDAYFSAYTGDISFTGNPNTGNIDVDLHYDETNDGSPANAGFNLVSNPYPCAINYSELINSTTNPDIDASIYIWDDGGSNTGQRTNSDYITINELGVAGAGSGRSADWNGYIGSAQGFFVKSTTSGTLHFTDDMKEAGFNTDGSFFRQLNSDVNKIKLSLSSDQNESFSTIIGFLQDATVGLDRSYDAAKLSGSTTFSLYSLLDNNPLTIQGLPLVNEETKVNLGYSILAEGEYKISIDQFENFKDINAVLVDHKLNKEISLSKGSTYTFVSNETEINNSRFSLILSPTDILNTSPIVEDISLLVKSNGMHITSTNGINSNGQVVIMDIQGRVLLDKIIPETTQESFVDFEFKTNQLYIISFHINGKSYNKKYLFNN